MIDYRDTIARDIAPVRPLMKPSRRVWLLVPIGLILATTAPFVNGTRGDLIAYAPLLTWGATALQSLLGLWLLALSAWLLESIGHTDLRHVEPWVNDLATRLGYSEEQLQALMQEVPAVYAADRVWWLMEQFE